MPAPNNASDEFVDITERPDSLADGPARSQNGDHLTPDSAGARQGKKKVNPLVDLIDTEKSYVDLLAAIIRRVAAAWSRTNFPPPELDAVFRSVEVVYRANRSLLAKLNEIGPNPSSPKALGDLLMRWIDDLEAPYTRYCDGYTTSFDTWIPVQRNPNLQPILEDISSSIPPSNYATSLDPIWTLDTLFLMPATRLKYYKKLYARLLKSTQPGRSDHKLLLGANDRLSRLLGTVEERAAIRVGNDADHGSINVAPPAGADAGFSPPPRKSSAAPGAMPSPAPSRSMSPRASPQPPTLPRLPGMSMADRDRDVPPPPPERESTTSSSSGRDSRHTDGRDSHGSVPTSTTSAAARTSTSTMSAPIVDLERRLSTDRVIDIFTMTPRKCRLQMAPPNLTFKRRVRFSADVVIDFTPRSTGVPVQHRDAHIFLLTDLFLVCERMSEEDKRNNEGADMWLCYPPLSAKHLVALDLDGPEDNVFEIRIMKKEVLIIHTDSRASKQAMLQDFREGYEETMALAPAKPPGPGFPPRGSSINDPSRSQTQSPPANRSNSDGMGMEPPRAQFGRLAAGSEPHLPMGPGGDDPSSYIPPPRGASRGGPGGPPQLGRANSSDNIPPMGAPQRMNNPPQLSLPGVDNSQRRPSDPHMPNNLPPLPPSPLPPLPNGRGPNSLPPHSFDPNGNNTPPFTPLSGHHPGGPGRNDSMGPPSSFDQANPGSGLRSGAPSMRSFDTSSAQSRQASMAFSTHGMRGGPNGPPLQTGGPGFPGPGGPGGPQYDSPPSSPDEERPPLPVGPLTSTITADMKCKVFLKQQHAQWKALGSAKLLLYQQEPGNIKQLVVNADNKSKTMIISTIVLMDAVERVGKTGVAIELSDQGQRTGIVYMIQLKSEASASGFFTTLLAGSDRAAVVHH